MGMANSNLNLGITLPEGLTASTLLHDMMRDAVSTEGSMVRWTGRFGDRLSRDQLADSVLLFEALRAGSPRRTEIAQQLLKAGRERFVFRPESGRVIPLAEAMARPADPLPLRTINMGQQKKPWVPHIPYDGQAYHGDALKVLAGSMAGEHHITEAANTALHWIADQGTLDLHESRFVIMGAGAELAPTQVLLAGGAKILWIDVGTPERFLTTHVMNSGALVYPRDGANLLTQPAEIAATIAEFAQGQPFHVGAFAYVGANAMEWRLTSAMNAIVRALDPALVSSFSLYISPSAPAKAEAEDVSYAREHRRGFLKLLERMGRLKPNHFTLEAADEGGQEAPRTWVRSIVARQGASYLAAQYLEKRLMAEILAMEGLRSDVGPIAVSANVAGISDTRSMQLPAFQAGFAGRTQPRA